MVSTIQRQTLWLQQVGVELWGHREWRALIPALAGIYREDERRKLSTRLDELRVPLRPLLSVVRLQGTQEPAQSHLHGKGINRHGAWIQAASANCDAESYGRSCIMWGETLTYSHRPHQTVQFHQSI